MYCIGITKMSGWDKLDFIRVEFNSVEQGHPSRCTLWPWKSFYAAFPFSKHVKKLIVRSKVVSTHVLMQSKKWWPYKRVKVSPIMSGWDNNGLLDLCQSWVYILLTRFIKGVIQMSLCDPGPMILRHAVRRKVLIPSVNEAYRSLLESGISMESAGLVRMQRNDRPLARREKKRWAYQPIPDRTPEAIVTFDDMMMFGHQCRVCCTRKNWSQARAVPMMPKDGSRWWIRNSWLTVSNAAYMSNIPKNQGVRPCQCQQPSDICLT